MARVLQKHGTYFILDDQKEFDLARESGASGFLGIEYFGTCDYPQSMVKTLAKELYEQAKACNNGATISEDGLTEISVHLDELAGAIGYEPR